MFEFYFLLLDYCILLSWVRTYIFYKCSNWYLGSRLMFCWSEQVRCRNVSRLKICTTPVAYLGIGDWRNRRCYTFYNTLIIRNVILKSYWLWRMCLDCCVFAFLVIAVFCFTVYIHLFFQPTRRNFLCVIFFHSTCVCST